MDFRTASDCDFCLCGDRILRLEGDRGIKGDGALEPGAILEDSECSGMNE